MEKFGKNKLEALLSQIEAKIADLEARMPAHSVKPEMIIELEELEEERDRIRDLLSSADN